MKVEVEVKVNKGDAERSQRLPARGLVELRLRHRRGMGQEAGICADIRP